MWKRVSSNMYKFAQPILGAGVAIVCGVALLPETVFINYYRDHLASYKDGQAQSVDKDTYDLLDQILTRTRIRAKQEANLELFTCYGQDPVVIGSLNTPAGAYIGLPPHFAYKTVADVQTSDYRLQNRYVLDWDSDAGKSLKESLVLTDQDKSFCLSRQLNYALGYEVHIKTLIRFGAMSGTCIMGFMAQRALNLRLKSWGVKVVYTLLGSTWFLVHLFGIDLYQNIRDRNSDKKAAELGLFYAEGGVSFYKKTLQRNIALHTLSGDGRLYTAKGNEMETWRLRHLQLTSRLKLCEHYVELWKEGKLQPPKLYVEETPDLFSPHPSAREKTTGQ